MTARSPIIGFFVGVTLLAGVGCGSTAQPAGMPTTSAPSATGTPASAPGGKAFGSTITSPTGAQFTVLAFQAVSAKSGASTPNAGGAFFAANVQECAGSGPTLTTDPAAWMAVFSGNEQAQGRDARSVATPGPPLATGATVATGLCAGGWVAFTGFADGIPREVHRMGLDSWWLAG